MLLLGVFPRGAEASDPLREPIRRINNIISGLDEGEYVREGTGAELAGAELMSE